MGLMKNKAIDIANSQPREDNTCVTSGKAMYIDETSAWKVAALISAMHKVALSVYHCGYCDLWHLTKEK